MPTTTLYERPVTELIRARFSCRHYLEQPIAAEERHLLARAATTLGPGPFGTRPRFELLTAMEGDPKALRGLGTYGFIRGATGFIVGAVSDGEKNLEDLGYLMECLILLATDLGLGTCWLGGTFTKSRFARRIRLQTGEQIPAVASVGYDAGRRTATDAIARTVAGSDHRLPWEVLFFDGDLDHPLAREEAGAYATPLESVRLGPSASNKQPWRIVRQASVWHFYMQRARLYRPRTLGLVRIADMPRLDMGIAMCHFELTAREQGLAGEWRLLAPGMEIPDGDGEYVASWVESTWEGEGGSRGRSSAAGSVEVPCTDPQMGLATRGTRRSQAVDRPLGVHVQRPSPGA